MSSSSAVPKTEAIDDGATGLDTWDDAKILARLLNGQRRAIDSVAAAIPALSRAAQLGAAALRGGGRLVYVGAGSPALISLADALEVPATYGIDDDRIVLVLADQSTLPFRLDGAREDDAAGGAADIAALQVGTGDCVIGTSASGTTPFTVEALRTARASGASTVGIAGNAGTPLFEAADLAVLLDAGPEVISGSTRMGAGTAQKAALNMLSTLIGVRLGHVHDGMMVNFRAENGKLRGRAARVVAAVTGVDTDVAMHALMDAGGAIKPAILIAAGASSFAAAKALLDSTRGNVRSALGELAAASGGSK